MKMTRCLVFGWVIICSLLVGCAPETAEPMNKTVPAASETAKVTTAADDPKGEFMRSETGTASAVPKPGKANIQGKVFYNLKPVAGTEVRLCVSPNMFGDCVGEKHTAKTDENGQYLFANLEPRVYGGMFVRVFGTDSFVFMGKDALVHQKVRAEPDKTFFVPLTSLFKTDLKVTTPRTGAKVDGGSVTIEWKPYPDAAYYTVDLFSFGDKVHRIDNRRTADTVYRIETPMPDGGYRLRVEAFNSAGIKIAQAGSGIEFAITGGKSAAQATPAPTEKPPFER